MVVQLIAKDKYEIFQFQGRCKLILDTISKLLLIEPFDEEYDFQDFVLIFGTERLCRKLYGHLMKKGATCGNTDSIQQRFLHPLFNEISKNNESSLRMKEVLHDWIEKHESDKKEENIQLLKDNNIYDLFYPVVAEDNRRNLRKRKANDMESNTYEPCENNATVTTPTGTIKGSIKNLIIKKPNFKIIHYKKNGIRRSRLFIFTSSDKKLCYEYRYVNSRMKFYCCKCMYLKKYLSATICETTENSDDDVIQLDPRQHACEIKKYSPENYLAKEKIVKPPNFRVITFYNRGVQRKKLIVFDSTNSSLCHEYYWSDRTKLYLCCGCITNNEWKKQVTAKIYKDKNGNDYVRIGRTQHICDLREFDPAKFVDDKVIYKPGYELFEGKINGKETKILYIFAGQKDNKILCYKFFYYKRKPEKKSFYTCSKCFSSNYSVNASIRNDSDGNEMAVLRMKNQHRCEPIEYVHPENLQRKIVMPPDYQLVKRKANGKIVQRLALFDSKNRDLCYEYTWCESSKKFACRPCSKKYSTHVSAKVKINESGEEYVELSEAEHRCSLRKFVQEDVIGNILKEPDFKIDKYIVKGAQRIRIIVYDKKKKRGGYFYVFTWKRLQCYICNPCKILGKYVSVKLREDRNGERYLEANDTHICASRNKL